MDVTVGSLRAPITLRRLMTAAYFSMPTCASHREVRCARRCAPLASQHDLPRGQFSFLAEGSSFRTSLASLPPTQLVDRLRSVMGALPPSMLLGGCCAPSSRASSTAASSTAPSG